MRYFDPARPIVLLKWGDVRPVDAQESARLRAAGARWLALAGEPYDKTVAGEKSVEVRNRKTWLREFLPGQLVVLNRAYRLPHAAAVIAARHEFEDLATARADVDGRQLIVEARL